MKRLKIRFNHDHGNTKNVWRVLLPDGSERHVAHINLNVPSFTTTDEIAPGVVKSHISCNYNTLTWGDGQLTVS